MSNIWFTSDFHLGHEMVAKLRGFDSVDEHDAWITDMWDSTVGKNDQVIFLGDLTLTDYKKSLEWIDARPGIKQLIPGNHDPVFVGRSSAWQQLPRWSKHFRTIQHFAVRKIAGHKVLLSHFPYADKRHLYSRHDDRYLQYRLPDEGMPMIHGHTHDSSRGYENMLHIGVDAWSGFVSLTQVKEWLDGR